MALLSKVLVGDDEFPKHPRQRVSAFHPPVDAKSVRSGVHHETRLWSLMSCQEWTVTGLDVQFMECNMDITVPTQ